jgi:hypothetical protein
MAGMGTVVRRVQAHGAKTAREATEGRAISRSAKRVAAGAVVGVMFVSAFAMWTVIPAAVLVGIYELAGEPQLQALLLGAGLVGAMTGTALVLHWLNGVYCRLIGKQPARRGARPWGRPLCNPNEGRPETGVLEGVMIASFLAAFTTLVIWFMFVAECRGGGCSG